MLFGMLSESLDSWNGSHDTLQYKQAIVKASFLTRRKLQNKGSKSSPQTITA